MADKTERITIGLLINQIEGRYQSLILRGISDLARERGAGLRIYAGRSLDSPYAGEDVQNVIYSLARGDGPEPAPDGLVVAAGSIGNYLDPARTAAFLESFKPIPVVAIGMATPGFPSVEAEGGRGVGMLVDHLARVHGFRRISFLAGAAGNPDAAARRAAWKDAILGAGIDPADCPVLEGDFSYHSAQALASAMDLSDGLPFDALVCANDDMALGFMQTIKERGFECPRDYAITGFDDIPDARFVAPSLTTVRQPLYEEARRAGEILLGILAGGSGPDPAGTGEAAFARAPGCAIVMRESCGCSEIRSIGARQRSAAAKAQGEAPLKDRAIAGIDREFKPAPSRSTLVRDATTSLCDAFQLDLRQFKERPLFLQVLEGWLAETTAWGDFSEDWSTLLSLIHREALATAPDASARAYAEDLFGAAFATLARKSGERDARALTENRNIVGLFRDLAWKLGAARDEATLAAELCALAPHIGFDGLRMELHAGGGASFGPALDYAAMRGVRCIPPPPGAQTVLLPLVGREKSFGYIVLSSPKLDALFFEMLRDQVSQSLQTIDLLSQRFAAEKALRRSEERYREIASAVPMMVMETDRAFRITYANAAGREGLGLGEDWEGTDMRRYFGAEDKKLAEDLARRIADAGELAYPGIRLMNPEGRRFIPVASVACARDAEGRPSGMRWYALDTLPFVTGGLLPDRRFFLERRVTERETDVVEFLLQGYRIKDIADKLCIAESTVKGHLTQVYDKLGISGKGELLRLLREEQVGRHGFSAYVFSLVNNLLSADE